MSIFLTNLFLFVILKFIFQIHNHQKFKRLLDKKPISSLLNFVNYFKIFNIKSFKYKIISYSNLG